MLTKFKKTVAIILVVTMLTAIFTITPAAAKTNSKSPITDTMNYSVTGSNALGDILADEIAEYQSQNNNSDGSYVISEITITKNIATVTFSAKKNCNVLVAAYDENTDQMLISGRAKVLAHESSAIVTLETDSMPKAFVLRGFLLSDSNAPLSEAYYTEMYTTDMQQLLQSTVDDYDAEKVLNIDDNPSTNFMIYSDDVQKFDCNETVNTIEKADSNGDSYIFTNADEKLKRLKQGDIFACDNNPQNPVIFKVGETSVDGDTVKVITADISLEQAFDCVKIESSGSADDAKIDESMVSPGMKYVGAPKDEEAKNNKKDISSVGASYNGDSVGAVKINKKAEYEHEFEIGDLKKEIEGKNFKFEGKLGGSIDVGGSAGFNIYLSFSGKKSVSVSADFKAYYKLYAEGSFEFEYAFVKIPIPVAAKAIVIEFDVAFFFEASGKFEIAFETSCSAGFKYTSGGGFKNTSQAPKADYSTNVEGEVYTGFKLTVAIVTGDKDIASAGLNTEIGLDITASPTLPNINIEGVTVNHDCKRCVSGDISLKLKIYPSVELLKKNIIADFSKDFEIEVELTPWYYSFTHNDFGFDICRYANVSFYIRVVKDGVPVENAEVMDTLNGTYLGVTDYSGRLYVTLDGNDKALYQIYADKDNVGAAATIRIKDFDDILALEDQEWKSFKSSDNYKSGCYEIDLSDNDVPEPTVAPTTKPKETKPPVTEPQVEVLDSGKCGDNITYQYLSDSTLKLNGTGRMYDYKSYNRAPWEKYKNKITSIEMSQGITSISDQSFHFCHSLTNIIIPNSVKSIGDSAFYGCYSLIKITIPDSVTSIGDYAFNSCVNLTSINIPDSVVSIGDYAFNSCVNLTSINIPDSVVSIGDHAFNCKNLSCINVSSGNRNYTSIDGVLFNKNLSKLITYPIGKRGNEYNIPNSVTYIGEYAFYDCDSLIKITIPNSVTSISDYAFSSCVNLTSITIPDSVTRIGNSAFSHCLSLLNVEISNGVTSIGKEAFYQCSKLTKADLSNADSLNIIGERTFYDCIKLTEIYLPNTDSLKSIGDYAFFQCHSLSEIIIPNSVTSIGSWAFKGCTGMTKVRFPNQLKYIGETAFGCCDRLTNVDLSNASSLTSIGDYAFESCDALTNIDLSNASSLISIGNSAFTNCALLTNIDLLNVNNLTSIGNNAFNGTKWYENQPDGIIYVGKVVLGIKGDRTKINTLILNKGTEIINESAFSSCTSLENIIIPNSVTSIGDRAFKGCIELTSITIPSSVTSIGDYAFSGTGLTNITIPSSIKDMGYYVFSDCCDLKSVTIADGVTNISDGAFDDCNCLTSITIPNSVTSIGALAFSGTPWYIYRPNGVIYAGKVVVGIKGDKNIKTLTLNEGTKGIASSAFYYCTNLESIIIPNSVTNIGSYAFGNCTNLKNVTIPDSVTNIGSSAFDRCNSLINIIIPDSITNIRYGTFSGCTSLENITIPDSITSIGNNAFNNCTSLKNITIPNNVTNIGLDAFKSCTNLESITIPSNVTYISDDTFNGCRSLDSITISDSVTNIGHSAFIGCTNLKNITIPSSVIKIGDYAFEDCSNLTSVILSKKTSVASNAFLNCPSNLTFHYYENDNTTRLAKPGIESVSAQSETVTTFTAKYSNQTAYAYYIIAAVKDKTTEDVLSADNLIYITQATADENGSISSDLSIPANVTDYDVVLYGPGSLSVKRTLIGDVNFNKKIQIDDVTLIQKYIVMLTTLSKDARTAADCDGNGDINIKDATLIQMYIAGYESYGKVGEYINNDEPTTTNPGTIDLIATGLSQPKFLTQSKK